MQRCCVCTRNRNRTAYGRTIDAQPLFLSQVLHDGKDCFPNDHAHTMVATHLDACKRVCIDRGYGAFVVVAGVAHFKKEAAGNCRAGLVDRPDSQVYLCEALAHTYIIHAYTLRLCL